MEEALPCTGHYQHVIEFNHDCVIEDASLLQQKTGECLTTPEFFAESRPDVKWSLKVYPRGEISLQPYSSALTQLRLSLNCVVKDEKSGGADSTPLFLIAKCKCSLLYNGKDVTSLAGIPTGFVLWKCDGKDPSHNSWISTRTSSFIDFLKSQKGEEGDELKICCQLVFEGKDRWINIDPNVE